MKGREVGGKNWIDLARVEVICKLGKEISGFIKFGEYELRTG
jgi:hypothetical protein